MRKVELPSFSSRCNEAIVLDFPSPHVLEGFHVKSAMSIFAGRFCCDINIQLEEQDVYRLVHEQA